MEPVTHVLSGFVLAGLGFRQKFGDLAAWIMVIASMFPDIDGFIIFFKKNQYLKYHRALTHSLVGIVLLSSVLALIFSYFLPWISFWWLWFLCLSGMALHTIFDYFTSYGTRILYPFSKKFYSLDLNTILDLWFFLPLLIGLSLLLFFPSYQFWIATTVFCAIGLNCSLRWQQRKRARAIVVESTLQDGKENGPTLGVLPLISKTVFNPFWWEVIEYTEDGYRVYFVNTLLKRISSWKDIPYAREIKRYTLISRGLAAFLAWSRFPYGKIEEINPGKRIVGGDLRFNFSIEIKLDKEGNLRAEKFNF